MKKFSLLGAALAAATRRQAIKAVMLSAVALGAAPGAFAGSYAEVGDAGDIVSGAPQAVTGAAGETITSIAGTLGFVAGISEVDAYKIYINSPSTFSASTTAFVPGANNNNFDTQLFLFSLSGVGIVGNDDDGISGGAQSTIPAGTSFVSSLTPGYYILMVTGGQNPASSGGLIFPSWTTGADPTGVYGPTGPGGSLPISSFGSGSNEGGAYAIALTGVTTSAVAVPEPSSMCLGLAGGLALLVFRRRRQGSDR